MNQRKKTGMIVCNPYHCENKAHIIIIIIDNKSQCGKYKDFLEEYSPLPPGQTHARPRPRASSCRTDTSGSPSGGGGWSGHRRTGLMLLPVNINKDQPAV